MTDRTEAFEPAGAEVTATRVLPLAAAGHPVIAKGIAYWDSLRGDRRFPTRAELSPRAMASFLKNVAIIDVVESGQDYCYRLIGDAHIEARGRNFTGETLRSIEERLPNYARRTRKLFDNIRDTGEACIVRGSMDPRASDWNFNYRECAFLPLGENDNFVDGLLAIGVYGFRATAQ